MVLVAQAPLAKRNFQGRMKFPSSLADLPQGVVTS